MAPPDKTERLALLRGELAKLPADTLVVYADEVDIHLNPKSGPDWTPKGVRKTLVTPGQNAKRYVAARWISFRAVGGSVSERWAQDPWTTVAPAPSTGLPRAGGDGPFR